MNETKTEWRDCADPEELAAAVAAGVEVRWAKPGWSSGEWALSTSSSPANFAGAMRRGNRYSVPTSWTWSPEPPASEGVRRVWTCKVGGNVTSLPGGADAPMRRAVATAFTELTGHPVEFCFSGWGDDLDEAELAVVEDRAPDAEVIRAALVKRLAALPDPSPGVTSMACDHPNPCTPEPPAPDDLVSRARRHADTHPESRDLTEALLAAAPTERTPDGDLRADVIRALYRAWVDNRCHPAPPMVSMVWSEQADAVLAVLPPAPTPPPAPPCDDDENDDIARLSPDQGGRIVDACCRMLGCEPADIDGDAAYEEILTEAVERCADLHGQDRWEDDCHGCGFRVGDHTTDGRCPPAPSPVPPWPGAVLSGLTDEDGVPTWLAQAGQVRGEQVRIWHGEPWGKPHGSWADSRWVEVRAPRAVPAPETERVPWWEAKDRLGLAGDRFVEVGADDEGPWVRVVEGGTKLHSPVEPDGTVKVLKDGDR